MFVHIQTLLCVLFAFVNTENITSTSEKSSFILYSLGPANSSLLSVSSKPIDPSNGLTGGYQNSSVSYPKDGWSGIYANTTTLKPNPMVEVLNNSRNNFTLPELVTPKSTTSSNIYISNYRRGSPTPATHKTEGFKYQFRPPKKINYTSVMGTERSYPVQRNDPPLYVYQYMELDIEEETLTAGLALMNLAILEVNADINSKYNADLYDQCKIGLLDSNGRYKDIGISCEIMSGFIANRETSIMGEDTTALDCMAIKQRSTKCFVTSYSPLYVRKCIDCDLLRAYAEQSFHKNSALRNNPMLAVIVVVSILKTIL